MGRTLKQVPLDFNWPLNKTWPGYLNPFSQFQVKCEACEGKGYSSEGRKLFDKWYGYGPFSPEERDSTPFTTDNPIIVRLAERNVKALSDDGYETRPLFTECERLCNLLNGMWMHHLNDLDVKAIVKKGRLYDFTHELKREKDGSVKWIPKKPLVIPSAKEVNEWSIIGFGHDALNQSVVFEAECKRLGVPKYCEKCKGEGYVWASPKAKRLEKKWKDIEPPKGKGFQLWETTSDGSPQSPVFGTLDELCEWCEKNATTFGSSKTSAAEWKKMLDEDFVCHKEGNMVFI